LEGVIVFAVLVLLAWTSLAAGFGASPDGTIEGWWFTGPCLVLLLGSVVLAVNAL
jgi:hypothetical protein